MTLTPSTAPEPDADCGPPLGPDVDLVVVGQAAEVSGQAAAVVKMSEVASAAPVTEVEVVAGECSGSSSCSPSGYMVSGAVSTALICHPPTTNSYA